MTRLRLLRGVETEGVRADARVKSVRFDRMEVHRGTIVNQAARAIFAGGKNQIGAATWSLVGQVGRLD